MRFGEPSQFLPGERTRLIVRSWYCAGMSALLAAVWLGSASTWAQSPGTAASAGTKRALLIGINSYQTVPSLSGSLNDVAAVRQVLATRWGFDVGNIRVLTERAATRSGILAALQQLVREAGPQDVVYVHYSGHGSQVQDLSGDEDDGLDETLVPHDGRSRGVPDILDDELDAIFSRLRAGSALIVLDSCHSGTATRAMDIRTRSVPRDARIELYRETATTTRAVVPRMEARQILMTGAAADQEALDGPVEGEYRGFFSYALTRSLAVSRPNASPRAVFAGVEQELRRIQAQRGRHSMPEPQLEGPPALLDRPLLVGSVDAMASPNEGGVSRSAKASELLAIDNPGSRVNVSARVVGAEPATRDIVLADARPAQLHIRRSGEPRTPQNSLQLAIHVNADTYVTIVDIDADGNPNLLFPNDAQRADFLPDGRVSANVPLLVPDSLSAGNRAGFFWDYGPPAGLDTIRVFASTDALTARLIRERVRALQTGVVARGLANPSAVIQGLDSLRRDLSGLATRGVVTVADAAADSAPDWAAATLIVEVGE